MNAITTTSPTLIDIATAGTSPESKRAYRRQIANFRRWFLDTGQREFNRTAVLLWKDHLLAAGYAKSTINQGLTAVRRMAQEMSFKGHQPEIMGGIVAVKNFTVNDQRLGQWLTAGQVRCLFLETAAFTHALKRQQVRALLVLLAGCALRREEAATVTWGSFQRIGEHWALVDVLGKGSKRRTVPVSPQFAGILREWRDMIEQDTGTAVLPSSKILRAVDRHGKLAGARRTRNGGMSDGGLGGSSIFIQIRKLGDLCGIDGLEPHDLRRTWAKTAYMAGHDLKQVSLIMGHSSIITTEKYLGINSVDLDSPQFVDFGIGAFEETIGE